MTKITKSIIIGFLILTTLGLAGFLYTLVMHTSNLPVLGEPGHTAGAFAFYNQAGKKITEKDIAGKVTVAEYFFTSCPGICKVMSRHLKEVYQAFKDREDFAILSHTVDPETDSVPVLANYARQLKAEAPAWQFLTGNKYDLYTMARQDYLLAVEDTVEAGSKEDFIHTEYVALLDKKRRIRGFYDATNKKSVDQLVNDISALLKE
ncbi:SCO family protein [Longitalea luteola]|uniref:SCO family protein n=1 Tax=Longitalea luteola TaxID=2812563 RepID=UPI001A95A6DE|nr:SCO family protein [Longitalea luteola]